MAKVVFRWHGDKFTRLLQREMHKRLDTVGAVVAAEAAKLIKTPGPAPSRPGEPPHIQTALLRRSVFWDRVARFAVRIGTGLKYGLYLEVGTRTMAARPWLRVALANSSARIKRILSKRLPGA